MFFLYIRLVEARQRHILHKAVQSTAVVSSLFPKQVRDRLLADDSDEMDTRKTKYNGKSTSNSSRLKSFLHGTDSDTTCTSITMLDKPIADLFAHCTVMFADICGFTAWSSTRSPDHVFILLQTLYHGFDAVARQRKVFKVETIGDCYVAVAGLPEPQKNHALIMARFAMQCRQSMARSVARLEVHLGPDCSDLKMRFGLHSGPVTAGVLRGDRARFQLFGDTVNTGKF